MTEITRAPVARVGVDPPKRAYQVHAVDAAGHSVLARAPPDRFFAWCTESPAGCIVAMEACGRAHHVARRYAGAQAASLQGIGPTTASALVASAGASQNSTGGKVRLGGSPNAATTTCAPC